MKRVIYIVKCSSCETYNSSLCCLLQKSVLSWRKADAMAVIVGHKTQPTHFYFLLASYHRFLLAYIVKHKNKHKMKIKITGIFTIPDWDIEEFNNAFEGFKKEFPDTKFRYEIINETTLLN